MTFFEHLSLIAAFLGGCGAAAAIMLTAIEVICPRRPE